MENGHRVWNREGLLGLGLCCLLLACGGAAGRSGAKAVSSSGFMGLFQNFPSSALFASGSHTSAAMAANPWLGGTRFFVGTENLCQDAVLPLSHWDVDVAQVTGYANPLQEVMIRMNADPDATWNIQAAASAGAMDDVVAGVVSVGNAAGTRSYMLDSENYATLNLLNNFDQTGKGNPLLNSPPLTRAQMAARLQAFGQAFGTSLWSRVPAARLYLFFGASVVLSYTDGGTGIPGNCPDSAYAGNPEYNLLPYFCLGLLKACPATGRIIDYCEASYYTFTGLASIQRNLAASRNWVSLFFPAESSLITQSASTWVPVPLIFANPYFDPSYGPSYPGAAWVSKAADQANYFTRNCLYCLQQTPAGYLPGIYIEGYDPWGLTGTVANLPATWQACLSHAISAYEGGTTLDSWFDAAALDSTLEAAFAGNSAWLAECH